jgi:hypothetical protein
MIDAIRWLAAFALLGAFPADSAAETSTPMNRSLNVSFEYQASSLNCLYEIEDRISAALEISGVGILDGDLVSVDRKNGSFYLFARDAHAALETIRPILVSARCLNHVVADVSLGPADDPATKFEKVVITP